MTLLRRASTLYSSLSSRLLDPARLGFGFVFLDLSENECWVVDCEDFLVGLAYVVGFDGGRFAIVGGGWLFCVVV